MKRLNERHRYLKRRQRRLQSVLQQTAAWLRELAIRAPVVETPRAVDLLDAADQLEREAASW